jgi:hypothetical protein
MLKAESPTALADLSRLPRGLSAYGASKFGKKFSDLSRKLNQEYGAGEDNPKSAALIQKQLAALSAAGPQGEYSASTTPEVGLTVTSYQDPKKAVAVLTTLYKGLVGGNRYASVILKEKPGVEESAAEHRGFAFTRVRLHLDFDASVKGLPDPVRQATLDQMKRLWKEHTSFWIGTDGKVVVQLTGSDWDAAKKLLDTYLDGKNGIATEPGFQLARKNLPETATLIYLLETSQVLTVLIDQLKTAGEAFPGGLPPIGQV